MPAEVQGDDETKPRLQADAPEVESRVSDFVVEAKRN